MNNLSKHFFPAALLLLATCSKAQIPAFPLTHEGLVINRPTQPVQPFTVAGTSGVLVGTQDGQFESWILPIKLLSHLTIEANLEGYSVPIPVNPQSAQIEVRPDHTTITYAHLGFTIRQIMFSPDKQSSGSQSGVSQISNLRPGTNSDTKPQTQPSTGPIVLFQIEANHPLDLTFRFTPEMRWMWPKRNEGIPSPEWVPTEPRVPQVAPSRPGPQTPDPGGFYILHLDYEDLTGAITIPTATPGILAPYQERPQVHPLELHLHYDPKRDGEKCFPLLMAAGTNKESSSKQSLGRALSELNTSVPTLYAQHAARYQKLFSESTSIQTPDHALNEAFQWGIASIEQLKAQVPTFQPDSPSTATSIDPGVSQVSPPQTQTGVPQVSPLRPGNDPNSPDPASSPETALVAGYYASGDSARPGFGWFFGRDSLFTLYATNSYGDFALTRAELEFLIARQRADGKIMHEFAQTAADPSVRWRDFEYMYAAADATPLFLMAIRDYYRASGDKAFLESHKAAIEKAWTFETAPTSDTDHDGIYDNSQGTGWTESWHGDPHQEVYLALLDEQASQAYAALQTTLGNTSAAQAANTRAEKIKTTIESEYYDPAKTCYAFSLNPDQTQDKSTTIYPAIAWWDYPASPTEMGENDRSPHERPVEGHDFSRANKRNQNDRALAPEASPPSQANQPLAHPAACLQQFAAPTLATDWGLRDVADTESFYDGMSYHQGSVWPLFTGWGALAEYRANQPLPAQQMLMQNVDLTWAQDPGAVTELLSGDFYVPFGRSTSHQLWSSAMVITPTLRGLFGINLDAAANTITINPHLPANWDKAEIKNLHLGTRTVDLVFFRSGSVLTVGATDGGDGSIPINLRSDLPGARVSVASRQALPLLEIPLHPIEIDLSDHALPTAGSRPQQPKIVATSYTAHRLTVTIRGQPNTVTKLTLRRNQKLIPKVVLLNQNQQPDAKVVLGGTILVDGPIHAAPFEPTELEIHFPKGQGWQTLEFTLTW